MTELYKNIAKRFEFDMKTGRFKQFYNEDRDEYYCSFTIEYSRYKLVQFAKFLNKIGYKDGAKPNFKILKGNFTAFTAIYISLKNKKYFGCIMSYNQYKESDKIPDYIEETFE